MCPGRRGPVFACFTGLLRHRVARWAHRRTQQRRTPLVCCMGEVLKEKYARGPDASVTIAVYSAGRPLNFLSAEQCPTIAPLDYH